MFPSLIDFHHKFARALCLKDNNLIWNHLLVFYANAYAYPQCSSLPQFIGQEAPLASRLVHEYFVVVKVLSISLVRKVQQKPQTTNHKFFFLSPLLACNPDTLIRRCRLIFMVRKTIRTITFVFQPLICMVLRGLRVSETIEWDCRPQVIRTNNNHNEQ